MQLSHSYRRSSGEEQRFVLVTPPRQNIPNHLKPASGPSVSNQSRSKDGTFRFICVVSVTLAAAAPQVVPSFPVKG